MAGRRPKPTALKLVKGTARAHRLNPLEPAGETMLADAPEHLNGAVREAWERFAALADGMRVLTAADGAALERLAECYVEVAELERVIQAEGRWYETKSVTGERILRTHPVVAMHSDADRRLKGYLVEFGFSPASRAKVRTEGARKQADPAEDFYSSAGG